MFNINQLNREFESRVRLGIMSVLIVNDWVDDTGTSYQEQRR